MQWQAEAYWLTIARLLAEQRALKAEAEVDRLRWARLKAETRLQRAAEKLRRRGYQVDEDHVGGCGPLVGLQPGRHLQAIPDGVRDMGDSSPGAAPT